MSQWDLGVGELAGRYNHKKEQATQLNGSEFQENRPEADHCPGCQACYLLSYGDELTFLCHQSLLDGPARQ